MKNIFMGMEKYITNSLKTSLKDFIGKENIEFNKDKCKEKIEETLYNIYEKHGEKPEIEVKVKPVSYITECGEIFVHPYQFEDGICFDINIIKKKVQDYVTFDFVRVEK